MKIRSHSKCTMISHSKDTQVVNNNKTTLLFTKHLKTDGVPKTNLLTETNPLPLVQHSEFTCSTSVQTWKTQAHKSNANPGFWHKRRTEFRSIRSVSLPQYIFLATTKADNRAGSLSMNRTKHINLYCVSLSHVLLCIEREGQTIHLPPHWTVCH